MFSLISREDTTVEHCNVLNEKYASIKIFDYIVFKYETILIASQTILTRLIFNKHSIKRNHLSYSSFNLNRSKCYVNINLFFRVFDDIIILKFINK